MPVFSDRISGAATTLDESKVQYSRAAFLVDCRDHLYAGSDRNSRSGPGLGIQANCRLIDVLQSSGSCMEHFYDVLITSALFSSGQSEVGPDLEPLIHS